MVKDLQGQPWVAVNTETTGTVRGINPINLSNMVVMRNLGTEMIEVDTMAARDMMEVKDTTVVKDVTTALVVVEITETWGEMIAAERVDSIVTARDQEETETTTEDDKHNNLN